ncbi:MAG: class I SAM-dependent methyltransferase [Thermodesulfovibrionia bacterium]|nr:class I SAM-dependent methyltransferase [Thermodesulfovibrionia bacterium]
MKNISEHSDYQLLDSGSGNKLERVGPHLLVRPSPQSVWLPSLPENKWKDADAVYIRSSSGGGSWKFNRRIPEKWEIEYEGYRFIIKPTGFGHLGIFPEQRESWKWISEMVTGAEREINVLNLFAYTGGSTLAAAAAGANVCHLDSAKGIVDWARENAVLSGLGGNPIRWIVDDVTKFIHKEIRRGKRYDAIILDPPSFGRGNKGEVWKIEDDLPKLLRDCKEILSDNPLFVLLSCHSPGFTPIVLQNLVADMVKKKSGNISCAEMTITEASSGRPLPCGCYARWSSK